MPTILAVFLEFSRPALWMSAAGFALLVIGLLAAKNDIAQARGIDKIVALTCLCFAIPLAVFGAEHLSSGKFMVNMVPSYMPWRLFWVYFVGFALIAASLSIATNGHPPALNEDFRVPITSDRTGNSRWVRRVTAWAGCLAEDVAARCGQPQW